MVTPTMFLGLAPALSRTALVASPERALQVILDGGIAVLPEERWDLADQVLALLGVAKRWRVSQLTYARTGNAIPDREMTDAQADLLLAGLTAEPSSGVLCVECGHFEIASVAQFTYDTTGQYLPAGCPVCHGQELPEA